MSDLSRVEDLAQRVADGLADEAEFAELEGLMEEDREVDEWRCGQGGRSIKGWSRTQPRDHQPSRIRAIALV